nr:MAG TPA: VPR/VPX protein [Caudoviricetes sp.]
MRGWSDVFKEIILQTQNDALYVHGCSHTRQPLCPEAHLEVHEMR